MEAMTKKEFDRFRSLIYERLGIALSDQKVSLLQSRLRKLAIRKGLSGYSELYDYFVEHGGSQADRELEDAITTNVTSFFREAQQWTYLKEYLKAHVAEKKEKRLRIWSAACSSGEEPYSIAMFLREELSDFASWDIKILASDISDEVLKKAMAGSYGEREMEGMPRHLVQRYFTVAKTPKGKRYSVIPALKQKMLFRKFNLVYGNYGIFSNPMDIIFCRNVMIYFDKPTQTRIDTHLAGLLRPGGLLLIGHSEAIPPGTGNLKLVRSSIYMKQ
jgi:chemotaxis protein methyltransferase CheR